MSVFVILGVLFITLIILIPLLEKSGKRMSEETTAKVSRWILPLCGVLLLIGLIKTIL